MTYLPAAPNQGRYALTGSAAGGYNLVVSAADLAPPRVRGRRPRAGRARHAEGVNGAISRTSLGGRFLRRLAVELTALGRVLPTDLYGVARAGAAALRAYCLDWSTSREPAPGFDHAGVL